MGSGRSRNIKIFVSKCKNEEITASFSCYNAELLGKNIRLTTNQKERKAKDNATEHHCKKK